MDKYEWSPALETGVADIDSQHKSLFELANHLQAAIDRHEEDPDAVADAVYGLVDYVVEHFKDEEALMAQVHYPGAGPHRSLHEQLSADTIGITARYFSGEDITPDALAPLVTKWLTEHIPTHDARLAAFVVAQRGAAQQDDPGRIVSSA
jgi:hemerythrin